MWVYALKSDFQGYVIRFKARVVALGNHQRPGIDFRETFTPVARMSSFRLLRALSAELGLQVYGADINTAYLNAGLGISQYLRSFEGYPCKVNGHMYVVLKALYGLRQSGREWNSELNKWLIAHGFQRSLTEPFLYYQMENDKIMYVLVYVDDLLVATNQEHYKTELFTELNKAYGTKDQGLLSQYLGVEVEQTESQIKIKQSKYAKEILTKFGYLNAHAVGNQMEVNAHLTPSDGENTENTEFPYREVVGMLLYLATTTRPDLAYVLGQFSRFVARPTFKHVGTVKRVLHYLAGTQDHGITYTRKLEKPSEVVLNGYCDSDWAMDLGARKSTTGFVFTLSNGAIAWMSRHQTIVALSTAEAKYVAACEAAMEAIAVKNILQEILPHHTIMLKLGIDNQAAYVMATNPTYSRRTRHIELRWHYVREQVERRAIKLHKVKGEDNPADAFTKALDKKRLKRLLRLVGCLEQVCVPTEHQQRHTLLDMCQHHERTDVVLLLQPEPFQSQDEAMDTVQEVAAHRVVLASAFFHALFTSGMKESTQNLLQILLSDTILSVLHGANRIGLQEVVEI
ncbi:Integrase catalytic core protein [Phytophthora palmivora]|uniref:Integrase catalytic core protein n=1 Tax=Phytophthora palmivora TaxID=4796 RepID=A0A2P4XW97_9STRA|nr:Integrase catalytic core protein [Phytophthora palmivora]